jgi:hypothetical protein
MLRFLPKNARKSIQTQKSCAKEPNKSGLVICFLFRLLQLEEFFVDVEYAIFSWILLF